MYIVCTLTIILYYNAATLTQKRNPPIEASIRAVKPWSHLGWPTRAMATFLNFICQAYNKWGTAVEKVTFRGMAKELCFDPSFQCIILDRWTKWLDLWANDQIAMDFLAWHWRQWAPSPISWLPCPSLLRSWSTAYEMYSSRKVVKVILTEIPKELHLQSKPGAELSFLQSHEIPTDIRN